MVLAMSAVNPLVIFYDIHGRITMILFFMDTTRILFMLLLLLMLANISLLASNKPLWHLYIPLAFNNYKGKAKIYTGSLSKTPHLHFIAGRL
jgi:hypothetical protein